MSPHMSTPGANTSSGILVTTLIELCLALKPTAIRGSTGEVCIQVPTPSGTQNVLVGSSAFNRWLTNHAYVSLNTAIKSSICRQVADVVCSIACSRDVESSMAIRVGESDGCWYLDLCDGQSRVVKISPDGWEIVNESPVKFYRPAGMTAIPAPAKNGDLNRLREVINVSREIDWQILCFWLLGALRPKGPYPVLFISGGQGNGKTTSLRILRSILDPNIAPVRTAPSTERDLYISASKAHVLAYDNLSIVDEWFSDALCRLSTGGGISCRRLYTDDQEYIAYFCRPIVFNSVDEIIDRPDLLDRTLMFRPAEISLEKRETEDAIWKRLNANSPVILGGLLDVACKALRDNHTQHPHQLPRLADFGKFCIAAEPHLGFEAGTFLKAYREQQQELDLAVVENVPVAEALRTYVMAYSEPIETNAQSLLLELRSINSQLGKMTPRRLSGILRRIAPNMKRLGLEIQFLDRRHDKRPILLHYIPTHGQPSEKSSA